jgi:ABC-2 type transport system ATP-binding protein
LIDMIHVEHFSKSYGSLDAVRDLNFDVGPGQILGLVGPNGAGKSTTLRTLSGILTPSAGKVIVAGHDVVREPEKAKSQLGYIPDDPRLFDTLTVWEHLAFAAVAYGVSDFEEYARELLQTFELWNKRDSLAHDLSRGMRQKVAIACAFLHRPKVLFFDEPLTGLDPTSIRTLHQCMRQFADQGVSIVVSSHLLGMIENVCSHLLVLHLGQCRYFGTIGDAVRISEGKAGSSALESVFFEITRDVPAGVPG